MPNKMLIDASHPEETRVVVLRGNRIEEFDFESASRKPLRGNIYLAKVTRVEPSLQAAFVEYGGNRHGFLAFSEIHPDYYQIPVADRQALLDEEAHGDDEEEEEEEERRPRRSRRRRRDSSERRHAPGDATVSEAAVNGEAEAAGLMIDADAPATEPASPAAGSLHESETATHEGAGESTQAVEPSQAPDLVTHDTEVGAAPSEPRSEGTDTADTEERPSEHHAEVDAPGVAESDEDEDDEEEEEEHIEQIGGDALEETPRRKTRVRRHYKIQEVIKRRQVLLVQVVKEERGNKGAALTTYLSLAGRYSVLMPNTARGGGISRKITDTGDRKRLKSIVQDLEVPEGMGIILRTAGAARTRPEVKRDFEYLLRMWENVRELTLRSSAPTLVYEEGSLIKRAIRDLFNKDIDDVLVSGDTAYQEARDFMRLIMPSHARNVMPWREAQPIFVQSGVEAQLDAMFSNNVTLKSGGYIVINQTEALVAIDVNSGRSTREHNIEDTALRTNLEASDEVARQLRLRDLAGLIVVDFIDMEENRNNRSVERRLKEALKNDRARIQVGRISHFGLLEMSRQRIRTGVLEGSTMPCPHCAGLGMVRSMSSVALHVLRVLEDALTKGASHDLVVRTRADVALYILNEKRIHLRDIERRFGVHVSVEADNTLTGSVYHALERGEPTTGTPEAFVPPAWEPEPEYVAIEADDSVVTLEPSEETDDDVEAAPSESAEESDDEEGAPRRRRRRRRRGGRNERSERGEREDAPAQSLDAPQSSIQEPEVFADNAPANAHPGEREGFWAQEKTGAPVPFTASRDEAVETLPGTMPLDHIPAAEPPATASMEQYAVPTQPTVDAAPRDMESKAQPVAEASPGTEPLPESYSHPEAAPAPAAKERAPAPVRPPRDPTEVVITRADPLQPKRGGWWSRAKATLTGE